MQQSETEERKSLSSAFVIRVDLIAKLLVVSAALSYAAGVVIVTLDLHSYGIAFFSLSQAQYVLVGTVWLALTGYVAFFPTMTVLVGLYAPLSKGKRTRALILSTVAGTIAIAYLMYGNFPSYFPFLGRVACALGIAAFTFWLFHLGIKTSVVGFRNREIDDSLKISQESTRHNIVATTIMATFILSVWLLIYNVSIYQYVSPTLGGGRHSFGRIVFISPNAPTTNDFLEQVISPIKLKGLTSEEVVIVLVDTDFVVIAQIGEPEIPILVNKKLIAGLQYEKETPPRAPMRDLIDWYWRHRSVK
jgi:hypothetical protein